MRKGRIKGNFNPILATSLW